MKHRFLPLAALSGLLLGGFTLPPDRQVAHQAVANPPAILEEVRLSNGSAGDQIHVRFSRRVTPRLRFVGTEECWQVDLPNVRSGASPVLLSGSGTVRMVRSTMVGEPASVMRLSVFVQPGVGLKVIPRDNGFTLNLSPGMIPGSAARASAALHAVSRPNGLLEPVSSKEEVVIALERSGPLPLLAELARRAGVVLRFRDAPPAAISCRGTAPNPIEALHMLATAMGMVLVDEGDAWRFSRPDNPLLRVSEREMIDGGVLEGLTLQEVLVRLAGPRQGEEWADRLGERAKLSLRGFSGERAAARIWVERLLQAHGIDPRQDEKHG